MTIGRSVLLLALVVVLPPAQAQLELGALMHELAQVKTARGRFVERKYLAILTTPLESSGTLVYTAPGRLEKHMLSPRKESLILDGDTLILERKDGERRFALQEQPVVRAFAESIRATLAGDLRMLERFYQVSLEGDAGRWRLRLKPTERRMREIATEILLSGSGAWVSAIEIQEAGGDRTVMTITRDAA
jgi:outer membrane lipoprotein-sorting protein